MSAYCAGAGMASLTAALMHMAHANGDWLVLTPRAQAIQGVVFLVLALVLWLLRGRG